MLDEPFPTNTGLSSSGVFNNYKVIGSMATSSSYTATLHRYSAVVDSSVAKRLEISAGTSISTVVAIALSLWTGAGLVLSVATSLVASAVGVSVDYSRSLPMGYNTYHYTYKFNVNNSSYYTYKFCRSYDYWYLDNSYELRGNGSGSHSGHLANSNLAEFAIENYQGGTVNNVACALSAS